jgi:hypothetical protein
MRRYAPPHRADLSSKDCEYVKVRCGRREIYTSISALRFRTLPSQRFRRETAAAFWWNSLLSKQAKYITPSLRTYPCNGCTEEEVSFARVVGRHAKRGASALLGKIVREKREQTAPSSLPHQRPCMAEIMQIRVGVVLRGYARHSPCVSETRESQSFHTRRLPTQRERETPSLFFSEALRFGGALSVASRKGNAVPKERAEKARRRGNSVQVYQVELEGVSYIFLQWAQRHPLPGAHSRTCVAARGPP